MWVAETQVLELSLVGSQVSISRKLGTSRVARLQPSTLMEFRQMVA